MNLRCDLDLKNNNLFSHKTLQLMMVYHPITCGCKKISSSVDMVETVILDYISPHCDPELEDSKPLFLYDTLAHDDASQYQVWQQKVRQFRRYRPDEHPLEWLNLFCDLDLDHNTAVKYFHKTIQLMVMCKLQKDQQFRKYHLGKH